MWPLSKVSALWCSQTSGDRFLKRAARTVLSLPDDVGSKVRAIERAMVEHAMRICNGNKSAAARMLGIDRKTLDRRIERLHELNEFNER